MSDYRITVKVRNERILSAIEEDGFRNIAQFCIAFGLHQNIVGDFVNLKKSPIGSDGTWTKRAIALANALNRECDDLWDDEQRFLSLEKNTTDRSVDSCQLKEALNGISYSAQDVLEELEKESHVPMALEILTKKQREIIEMRYGIGSYDKPLSLGQIGEKFEITRERVRQIENKALSKLRNNFGVIKKLQALDD